MDEWNESIYGEEFQEEEEEFEPSREHVLFLIDASPPMLEACEVDKDEHEEEDKDFAGLSWLEAAVKVALHIMKQKIIASSGDEVAVVLYSAATVPPIKNLGDFANCHLLQDLEQPGVDAVQKLENFSVETFKQQPGSTSEPTSLSSAFWLCKALTGRSKVKASKRILVFTCNQKPFDLYSKGHDPSFYWRTLLSHMRNLREGGAAVELYPMVPPGATFDLEPFWRRILQYLRGKGSQDGDGEEMEEAQQVFRLKDLFTLVRSKAHKKRSVGSVKWTLGGGLDLAVKLYQTLQTQKQGTYCKISGRTGHEVCSVTGQVDKHTGRLLKPEDIRQYFFKKGGRYPKVYMSKEEVAQIMGQGRSGMTLLGFKPASCLKEYHNIRNATFLYPDDKLQPGSATCFIALWQAMRESGTMAVCRLAATKARSPTLVALLPQEEALYEDDSQATPPGFQLIYLPFLDDIRTPEAHTDFTGTLRHMPSESQVAAAEVLVAELQLREFDCRTVLNPTLQRHYEVLEAAAAGREPPLLEDNPVGDPTLPAWEEEVWKGASEEEAEAVAVRMAAILGFKDAVGLSDETAKKRGTKKRAVPMAADGEAMAALGVEANAAAGSLKSLTNDQLKAWLRANGCAVGGKKEELIARVNNKLGL